MAAVRTRLAVAATLLLVLSGAGLIVRHALLDSHLSSAERVANALPAIAPYRTDPSDQATSHLSELSVDDAVWQLRQLAADRGWPLSLAEQTASRATVVIADTDPALVVSVVDDAVPGTRARTLVRIERAHQPVPALPTSNH